MIYTKLISEGRGRTPKGGALKYIGLNKLIYQKRAGGGPLRNLIGSFDLLYKRGRKSLIYVCFMAFLPVFSPGWICRSGIKTGKL